SPSPTSFSVDFENTLPILKAPVVANSKPANTARVFSVRMATALYTIRIHWTRAGLLITSATSQNPRPLSQPAIVNLAAILYQSCRYSPTGRVARAYIIRVSTDQLAP